VNQPLKVKFLVLVVLLAFVPQSFGQEFILVLHSLLLPFLTPQYFVEELVLVHPFWVPTSSLPLF